MQIRHIVSPSTAHQSENTGFGNFNLFVAINLGIALSLFLSTSPIYGGETLLIDFDGPGYVAGQRPPSPWTESYWEREGVIRVPYVVVAGGGIDGSQCLGVPYTGLFEGYAVYKLPRALTKADGPIHISVMYDPPGDPPLYWNFATYSSVYIGSGWQQDDTAVYVGFVFRLEDWEMRDPKTPDDFKILTPGGLLGYFSPSAGPNYHKLSFDIDEQWTYITYTVVYPDGTSVSNTAPCRLVVVDKIWLGPNDFRSDTALNLYDNLIVPKVVVPPQIIVQPSDQTVSLGSTVTFTVQVQSLEPVSYQWIKDQHPLEDNDRISGSNTSQLTISNVTVDDAGLYWVIVSTSEATITSREARVTVDIPLPKIIKQPYQIVVFSGQLLQVCVESVNAEAFLWKKGGLPLEANERISGITSSCLSILPAKLADGGVYTLELSNSYGIVETEQIVVNVLSKQMYPLGLVALWSADGHARDIVGGIEAVLMNEATFGEGKIGQAFLFAGPYDWVHIPEVGSIDISRMESFTICAWIYPTSFNQSWPTIYSEGRWGFSLGIDRATGRLESWINNMNEAESTIAVGLNQWSHVAMSWEGNVRKFYVNGEFAGESGISPTPMEDNSGSAIGNVPYNQNSSAFCGLIDEVAIYNRALTPSEIAALAELRPVVQEIKIQMSMDESKNITLSWPIGILQTAPTINGPWENVETVTMPFVVYPTDSAKFYRVVVDE